MNERLQQLDVTNYTPEQVLSATQDIILANIQPPTNENWTEAERPTVYADFTARVGEAIPYNSVDLKLDNASPNTFMRVTVLGKLIGYREANLVLDATDSTIEVSLQERNSREGLDHIIDTYSFKPDTEKLSKYGRLQQLGALVVGRTAPGEHSLSTKRSATTTKRFVRRNQSAKHNEKTLA